MGGRRLLRTAPELVFRGCWGAVAGPYIEDGSGAGVVGPSEAVGMPLEPWAAGRQAVGGVREERRRREEQGHAA
jgi:hypothetical protein